MHWNVVLDEREDGAKVWTAKCLRCDAVLVGEQSRPIPIVKILHDHPPQAVVVIQRAVHEAWLKARTNGSPLILPHDTIEFETIPDHGLQRALDAHSDACAKRAAKPDR